MRDFKYSEGGFKCEECGIMFKRIKEAISHNGFMHEGKAMILMQGKT